MFLGYFVLFSYPLIVAVFFLRLPVRWAIVWSITLGYLFLPSSRNIYIDLPILPPFDKVLIPSLAAAVFSWFGIKKRIRIRKSIMSVEVLPGFLPRSFFGLLLLALIIGGVLMTVQSNKDYLYYGPTVLPGHITRDIFSEMILLSVVLLPMLLGRKYLFNAAGHRAILVVFGLSALFYSGLALYEVRMSPQLNTMLYGFFPHSFLQHMRAGGFRPIVFLDHGLLLGIFFCCSILAVAALARVSAGGERLVWLAATFYLFGVLVLSKALGALVIVICLVPLILFLRVRLQLIAAAFIATIALIYPILRGGDVIPTAGLVDIANYISVERAASLEFRFHHEDVLLEKASERPLFGWGGWGRYRIFDENGVDRTVSDGEWIITIGAWGWVGYLARFGLLCVPLLIFAIQTKRYQVDLVTSGLCLVLAANVIDLIPNSGLTPLTWMCVGALLGRLEFQRSDALIAEMENAPNLWENDSIAGTPALRSRLISRPGQLEYKHSRFPPQHRRR